MDQLVHTLSCHTKNLSSFGYGEIIFLFKFRILRSGYSLSHLNLLLSQSFLISVF